MILSQIKKERSLSNVGHRDTKAENVAGHSTGEAFSIHELCLFLTKPCWTEVFSGPLEASWAGPVDGASIVRRLSLWLTLFRCDLVIDRNYALISDWPFSKRKMKCACTFGLHAPPMFSESAELSCACPIFRREKLTDPTRYKKACILSALAMLYQCCPWHLCSGQALFRNINKHGHVTIVCGAPSSTAWQVENILFCVKI